MAYDKSKDAMVWESEPSSVGLVARIFQYNNGKPKLGFVRQYEDFEGEIKHRSGGRLDMGDLTYFGQIYPEVNKVMKSIIKGTPEEVGIYPDEVDPDDIYADKGESIYDDEEDE